MAVTCTGCGRTQETIKEAKADRWVSYWGGDEEHPFWTWRCPPCAEGEPVTGAPFSVPTNVVLQVPTVPTTTGEDTVPGVWFGGVFFPDEPEPSEVLTVQYGGYKAIDYVTGRDLDKLQAQANYYSQGNVAQFVLDVFNRFVDRYERPNTD